MLGLECKPGSYCNYPISAQCGAGDQVHLAWTAPRV